MTSATYDYFDSNAAAGELNKVFAMDVTTAEGQCAHCGAMERFADTHVYMRESLRPRRSDLIAFVRSVDLDGLASS